MTTGIKQTQCNKNKDKKMNATINYITTIIVIIDMSLERLVSSTFRKFKAAIAPLILASALAVCPRAQAGMEWGPWGLTNDSNYAISESTIVNDNSGAVYDSYQVKLEDLANQIWSNNPRLTNTYSSATDLVTNGLFTYAIAPKPTSEVADGWESEVKTNGNVNLTNVGGIPGLDCDQWISSPGTNMQRGTLGVKKEFLDLDGDGWTTNDLTIANDTATNRVVGGVGVAGIDNFNDEIPRIKVILPKRSVTVNSTYSNWFGTNVVGNPSINGVTNITNGEYDYGTTVNVEVEKVIYDTNNAGRRLTVDSINVIEQ